GLLRTRPSAVPSESGVHTPPKPNADHRSEGPQREFLCGCEKVPGSVVHERVEGAITPYRLHELFHGRGIANVASSGVNAAAGKLAQFAFGRREHIRAPSADVNFPTQLQKPQAAGLAQAGPASGDENAFVAKKIFLKHSEILVGDAARF